MSLDTIMGVGAFLLAAGALFTFFVWSRNRRSGRRQKWTPVTGHILAVNFSQRSDSGFHGEAYPARNRDAYRSRYQYRVEGKAYRGMTRSSPGSSRYQAGDRVELLVDPNRPEHSVEADAVTSIVWYEIAALIAGGLLLLVGLGVLIS